MYTNDNNTSYVYVIVILTLIMVTTSNVDLEISIALSKKLTKDVIASSPRSLPSLFACLLGPRNCRHSLSTILNAQNCRAMHEVIVIDCVYMCVCIYIYMRTIIQTTASERFLFIQTTARAKWQPRQLSVFDVFLRLASPARLVAGGLV